MENSKEPDLDVSVRFVRNSLGLRSSFEMHFDELKPFDGYESFSDLWVTIANPRSEDAISLARKRMATAPIQGDQLSGSERAREFVQIGCTFLVQAEGAFAHDDAETAWYRLSQAAYWLGMLSGRRLGIEERTTGQVGQTMKRLQDARHAETRAMRQEAIDWYIENRSSLKSDQQAAEAIAKRMPVKIRTVQVWIGLHKKAAA